jgi:protein SCO1/2
MKDTLSPLDGPHGPWPSRRQLLRGAAALASASLWTPAGAHNAAGLVSPPLPVPKIAVTRHDGKPFELGALLRGRVTALQLMFTGCSATCPIQGALFAAAARQLGKGEGGMQLMSLSIDPLGDDAQALASWRARFGAGDPWPAVVPAMKDLDPVLDFLQGRKAGADRHTAQVYLFNRRAELVMRTVDFPPVAEVLRLLNALKAQA